MNQIPVPLEPILHQMRFRLIDVAEIPGDLVGITIPGARYSQTTHSTGEPFEVMGDRDVIITPNNFRRLSPGGGAYATKISQEIFVRCRHRNELDQHDRKPLLTGNLDTLRLLVADALDGYLPVDLADNVLTIEPLYLEGGFFRASPTKEHHFWGVTQLVFTAVHEIPRPIGRSYCLWTG